MDGIVGLKRAKIIKVPFNPYLILSDGEGSPVICQMCEEIEDKIAMLLKTGAKPHVIESAEDRLRRHRECYPHADDQT